MDVIGTDLAAIYAFRRELRKASRYELWQALHHRSAELLPFEAVASALHVFDRADIGIQQVPLDAIVGSVDRAGDFTRSLRPRKDYLESRWANVYAYVSASGFDPVSLYKISDVYFVNDGNHRVSVLRSLKATEVEAEVTEYACRVPLGRDLCLSALPRKAACQQFLQETDLDRQRRGAIIELSHPGAFRVLEEHIAGHAYWLEYSSGRHVSVFRAAASWYDLVYFPTMELIRRSRLVDDLPGLLEADLYVGLMDYHRRLVQELRRPVPLDIALERYRITEARPRLRRLWYRWTRGRRYDVGSEAGMAAQPTNGRLFNRLPTRDEAPMSVGGDETPGE